jgi:hypothetical protein
VDGEAELGLGHCQQLREVVRALKGKTVSIG